MGDTRNLRGFVKGQSGNPSGQPKGWAELRSACRAHTQAAIDTLVDCLAEADPRVRVAAATALLDRGWGRPAIAVEVSAKTGPSPAEAALLALATPVGEQVIDVQPSSPARAADEVLDAEDDGAVW